MLGIFKSRIGFAIWMFVFVIPRRTYKPKVFINFTHSFNLLYIFEVPIEKIWLVNLHAKASIQNKTHELAF